MAGANNGNVLNKFDIHLLTSECSKEFCIKWTLSNFSQFASDAEYESPLLKPVPECACRLGLRHVNKKELCLSLQNKSKQAMRVETSISIFDSKENLWHSENDSNEFDPDEKIDILDCEGIYKNLLSLKDDILIFICNFKITSMFITKCLSHNLTRKKYNGEKKLCDDLKILYSDKWHADITLKTEGAQVPANKAILSVRSAVFEKMFQHNMDEQANASVQIEDLSPTVLEKLVEFLYTGELDVENDFEAASALYYAADKYQVLDLRKMCADTLLALITVDNAAEIVVTANRRGDEYLKTQAIAFLGNNVNCVIESETWKEFVTAETKLAAQVLEYYVRTTGKKVLVE